MKSPEFQESFPLPPGFRSAGLHAGIKPDPVRKDMAMLVSDAEDTVVAGMFTTNKIKAAPVKWDMEICQRGTARAVVVNSGNANACTGKQGERDTEEMAVRTAEKLGLRKEEVLVSSTGSIGKPMKMDPVRKGIGLLAEALSSAGGGDMAQAILTTDIRPKMCSTRIAIEGREVSISGCCKGAGMIEPKMATMLAYVCTDANIRRDELQKALREAVNLSFNKISIDGDTSTNDSVICFASGVSDHSPLTEDHPDWPLFQTALNGVMFDLAMKIVWDGEGMTRFIELRGRGARSDAQADQALRAIANSFLVKTGLAGTYPAWSRMIDVLGYCGVEIEAENLSIWYNDIPVLLESTPVSSGNGDLEKLLPANRYTVTLDLGTGGTGEAVLYTCDCTEEYVRINMF